MMTVADPARNFIKLNLQIALVVLKIIWIHFPSAESRLYRDDIQAWNT